eukprot:9223442-Pyramimonas_sp.AAC.1
MSPRGLASTMNFFTASNKKYNISVLAPTHCNVRSPTSARGITLYPHRRLIILLARSGSNTVE